MRLIPLIGYIIGLSIHFNYIDEFLIESDTNSKLDFVTKNIEFYSVYQRLDTYPDILTGMHLLVIAVNANAEDTLHFRVANLSIDRKVFIEAMKKEMDQLSSL